MPESSEHVSSLGEHLGYWLRYVSNHVAQAFARKVEGQGVTVAEFGMLRVLYDGEAMPSIIAERMGMTRGAITKLADRLIEKGLVQREASADDRRAQVLRLTLGGRTLVPVVAALADQNDEEFFGHLDLDTRTEIKATMQEIVRRRGLTAIPTD
jgi:DNA-binding MarR family transcriptional regulator